MDRGIFDGVLVGACLCAPGILMVVHEFRLIGWIPILMGSSMLVAAAVLWRINRRG
jgi:hypothetical protein